MNNSLFSAPIIIEPPPNFENQERRTFRIVNLNILEDSVDLYYKKTNESGISTASYKQFELLPARMLDYCGVIQRVDAPGIRFVVDTDRFTQGDRISRDSAITMTKTAVDAINQVVGNTPLRKKIKLNNPKIWETFLQKTGKLLPRNDEYWRVQAEIGDSSGIDRQGSCEETSREKHVRNKPEEVFERGIILILAGREEEGIKQLYRYLTSLHLMYNSESTRNGYLIEYITNLIVNGEEKKDLFASAAGILETEIKQQVVVSGSRILAEKVKDIISTSSDTKYRESIRLFTTDETDRYHYETLADFLVRLSKLNFLSKNYSKAGSCLAPAQECYLAALDKTASSPTTENTFEPNHDNIQEYFDQAAILDSMVKLTPDGAGYNSITSAVNLTELMLDFQMKVLNPPDKKCHAISFYEELEWALLYHHFFARVLGVIVEDSPINTLRRYLG